MVYYIKVFTRGAVGVGENGVQIPLPDCIVLKIREKFPANDRDVVAIAAEGGGAGGSGGVANEAIM